MFSRISFKSPPDQFSLNLGFGHGRPGAANRDRRKVVVEWSAADSEAVVVQRVLAAISDPSLVEESVRILLGMPAEALTTFGVVAASTFHKDVALGLEVHSTRPSLESVELLRTAGSGAVPTPLAQAIWAALELRLVTRIRCSEGAAQLLDPDVMSRLPALRVLNLSHCGMGSLPGIVGLLQGLQELRLVGNRLKLLPPELGLLRRLRILAADSNELIILPGELRHCTSLEELTLENNKLTSVLLNFSAFPNLQVLHLYNNPLEFLPEISPCHSLRHLSVANLRVTADPGYTKFQVELLPASSLSSGVGGMGISLFDSSKKEDKLRPIFALMLRRSSGHHPLLAGALRQVAEQDPKNREVMARQENALQQLVLMALNDNPIVVEQTCATLRLLAQHSPALAESMVDNDVSSVMMLLTADEERLQLASLQVLAAVAFESPVAAVNVLTDKLLAALEGLVVGEGTSPRLRAAALEAVGNLAFAPKNRARLQGRQGLMDRVLRLAGEEWGGAAGQGPSVRVKAAAVRMLAVLGENDAVWRAVHRRPLISERGVRILSMDGGGMKGIATVRLLRELEARAGRRIHDMFDLICGTSTGGLLAVALGLRDMTLDECEHIYKVLGQKVFSRPMANKDKEETWMESFYRTFHSKTQHVRAVVVGYKHDAAVYETLLKNYCDFSKETHCLADSMIDTACLDVPKVALVSTLASMSPAFPFVFRNYELPPSRDALARQIHAHTGSSKHKVWQAVRASSAATYYLDDFSQGGDRFQDGAVVANNPAIIALQEARLLWPDAPIDVMVSVGSGSTPSARRGGSMSSFMETGSILIESACGVERPDEALATLLPLVPGVKYFRFSPLDARCGMELDEIDPIKWAQLEAATQDYIHTVAHKFDDAAAALAQGLDPAAEQAAPVAPTPLRDTLRHLRLGPTRHLTLLTSASPAPGGSTAAQHSLGQALTAVFTTVLDVQRGESRTRGKPTHTRSLSRSLVLAGAGSSGTPDTPPSEEAASSRLGDAQLGASPAPNQGQGQGSSTAIAAGATGPPSLVALAGAAAAAPPQAEAAGGAAPQGSQEEQDDGGSWFSWFSSPRKPPPSSPPPLGKQSALDTRPAQHVELTQGPAATNHTSGTGGSSGPAPSAGPEQAFLSFTLGKPRSSSSLASMGAWEAGAASGDGRPQDTGEAGPATSEGQPAGNADAQEAAASSQAAGRLRPDVAEACQPSASEPVCQPSAAEPADPVDFLAQQLGSIFDDDPAELGACHLALAPAGEGLVLSWHQKVEAVVEPSDSASALLSHLELDPSYNTLSDLFQQQPSISLPPPSSSDEAGQVPGGWLTLLSRQVQWVAGRQLSVLLLQLTVPHKLLTPGMLEGELGGLLAHQVAVCADPVPPRLLHALLGGAGAAAVVAPLATTGLTSNTSGAGILDSTGHGAGGISTEEAVSAFFFAFYAALKGGATLSAALDVAEGAQPALAGVFGVHGARDGALVEALP